MKRNTRKMRGGVITTEKGDVERRESAPVTAPEPVTSPESVTEPVTAPESAPVTNMQRMGNYLRYKGNLPKTYKIDETDTTSAEEIGNANGFELVKWSELTQDVIDYQTGALLDDLKAISNYTDCDHKIVKAQLYNLKRTPEYEYFLYNSEEKFIQIKITLIGLPTTPNSLYRYFEFWVNNESYCDRINIEDNVKLLKGTLNNETNKFIYRKLKSAQEQTRLGRIKSYFSK